MPSSVELIHGFYKAFQRRDWKKMAACYAPDATFKDEVFDLQGPEIGAMWRMLCERGKDLKLEFSRVEGNTKSASAHWEAWYTFTPTGRKVHNVIDASFTLKGGLITRHVDSFDLHAWSAQALGAKGKLLGGLGLVKNGIRKNARKTLDSFMDKHGLSG
jgi:ketosteroid isomerase-like protein